MQIRFIYSHIFYILWATNDGVYIQFKIIGCGRKDQIQNKTKQKKKIIKRISSLHIYDVIPFCNNRRNIFL